MENGNTVQDRYDQRITQNDLWRPDSGSTDKFDMFVSGAWSSPISNGLPSKVRITTFNLDMSVLETLTKTYTNWEELELPLGPYFLSGYNGAVIGLQ